MAGKAAGVAEASRTTTGLRGRGRGLLRLGSFFDAIAPSLQLARRAREAIIWTQWTKIVGDQVAAVTKPRALLRKTLYVAVCDSMWLQQLSYLQPLMLERIRRLAGVGLVERIFFDLVAADDREPPPAAPSQPAPQAAPLPDSAATSEEINQVVGEIPAGALRDALRRLFVRTAASGDTAARGER